MHADDAERPLLLIIRTGNQQFREYLLRSIAPHYRVHMFLGVEPTWEPQYIAGWTVVQDTTDVELMVSIARELDAREPISGVLCWDEARIREATRVAAALGLPGEPEAVVRCRDKNLTRQALAVHRVAQPQSVQVDTLDQARAEAARIGYPVILKPSQLALSVGVVRVDDEAELAEAFAFTGRALDQSPPTFQPKVLVEEYVTGEEISVDSAVHHGELVVLCLARKEIGYAPYCIEVGHYVHGDDPLLHDTQLMRLLHDTHAALGFTQGVTHTEIKLTPTGPKIIEVNARLGGDMIPYLGLRASGIDVGLAAAAVACGRAPLVAPDRKMVAAIRFFYPPEPMLITSIGFDGTGLPAAIDQLVVLAEPGMRKMPPPDGTMNGRVGFATAVAQTAEECRAALDAAEAALRIA